MLSFLQRVFCSSINEKIQQLESQNANLRSESELNGKKTNDYLKAIDALKNDLAVCNLNLSEEKTKLHPPLLHPEEIYWNNRKPQAIITYSGRQIPQTKTYVDVDVRLFLTPHDSGVVDWVRGHSFSAEGKPIDGVNQLIFGIYKADRADFKYSYDQSQFGLAEVWLFPFELAKIKQADCEDFAHRLASRLLAAKIPYWRVRVVVGTTYSGIGHSTVYVLGDDLKTWYHLNSTTPLKGYIIKPIGKHLQDIQRLEDMPQSNEPKDGIGIKDVWFSFSLNPQNIADITAWHTFETSGASQSFAKNKGMKKVKIHPVSDGWY